MTKDEKAIIQFAKEGATLFVQKVHDGRARSKVTYSWCIELLDMIDKLPKEEDQCLHRNVRGNYTQCPDCGDIVR